MTDTHPSRPAPGPEVTVVAVTWNAREALLTCLESLEHAVTAGVAEVVVIDNDSSDGTVPAVRAAAPWARVVANGTNRGLAAANNQGMASARAPHVLFTNPDVVFGSDTIPALLSAMARRPRAAFVFPRLVHPSGALQTSAGDLPTLGEALLGRQAVRRRRGRSGFWWDGWDHDEPARIGHGLEACYLVRRAAVAEFGVLDERFWLDWEGVDWCARAADAGWECWFEPAAEAVHVGGVSVRQATARWVRASHQSMYRYFAIRSPAWTRPALACLFATRGLVKLAGVRGAAGYGRSHPGSGAERS